MNRVKSMLGMRSAAEKRLQREAERAQRLQQRASEEELARARAAAEVSGRLARTGGRRALTWQGSETGVATTYGG